MSGITNIRELLEQGLYYYGLGEIKKAIELWHEVLKIDPGNETAREYIEIETGRASEKEPNEEILDSGSEIVEEPKERRGLAREFMEGQQYLLRGEWERAIKSFEAAHRADPADPLYWAHVELARARMMKDVFDQAEGPSSV